MPNGSSVHVELSLGLLSGTTMGDLKLTTWRPTCVEEAQGCEPVPNLSDDEQGRCHLRARAGLSNLR